MSDLLNRMKLAFRAGLQFSGKRDLYTVLGYKERLTYADFISKYTRQDIAARLIDAPVNATWFGDLVVHDDSGEEGEFANSYGLLSRTNHYNQYFERADRLSALGHYSVLLLGVSGNGDLKTPLVRQDNADFLYLQPYSQNSAEIATFEESPNNRRYGRPLVYNITMRKDPKKSSTTTMPVHYSRVLHIANTPLEDEVFGEPKMANIMNLLEDLIKVVGGSAETFWLAGNRGLQADIDKDMELDPDDAKDLNDEIEEYQHQLRRFIRTRGVKISNLGSDVADPRGSFEVIMGLLSGATGIPSRILLGSERGQLASAQDRANWAERINERRRDFAQPKILIPFVQLLVQAGILSEPEGEIQVIWPDAFIQSPLEKAQTAAQYARAATNLDKVEGEFITTQEKRDLLDLP